MKPVRIAIVGCSGSGKTTLARMVERKLGIPRLELDGVFHQPDWKPLEDGLFRERVAAFMDSHETWVIDGNYEQVLSDLVHREATVVIWLRLSRWRTVRQIAWRTVKRAVTRAELWNGNREHWRDMFSRDPERSMIAWAWTRHPICEERYAPMMERYRADGREVHAFVNHAQARRWLEAVAAGTTYSDPDGAP